MLQKPRLTDFTMNTYSQNGEDGILDAIISKIGAYDQPSKWCVEFGAWDGIHLSNTYNLIESHGFNAVLIEGDKGRYKQLCRNIPSENVIKICAFVDFEGKSSLEELLSETNIPENFDLLSIDIDSADYYIWEGLNKYKPKIVCIEYNPSIPKEIDFKQPKTFEVKWGSSSKAINALGVEKGYKTVAITSTNLICVRSDLLHFLNDYEIGEFDELAKDRCKVILFCGYDGTILSNVSELRLIWHRVDIDLSRMQYLPHFLRKYRGDYGFVRRALFHIYIAVRQPKKALSYIKKRLFGSS